MWNASWWLMAVLVTIVSGPGCSSPAKPPLLEPLWITRTGIEILSPDYLVFVEIARVTLMTATDGLEPGDFHEVPEAQNGRVFFDGVNTLYVAGLRSLEYPWSQPAVAALRVNVPDV